MFEQLPTSHPRHAQPRDAALTLLALSVHIVAGGGIVLTSSLSKPPRIPLPRLEITLRVPPPLPPGPPAPKLGSRSPSTHRTAAVNPEALLPQPSLQLQEAPAVPPDTPPPAESPEAPGSSDSPGPPGDPEGVPDGDPRGRKGLCIGPFCDPDGPEDGFWTGGPSGEVIAIGPGIPGVEGVTEPAIIESSKTLPRYPELARRARLEGSVILQAVIQTDGAVGSLKVLHVSRPRLGFEEAAVAAVSRWRYRPGTQHGRPVAVYLTVTIDFTLSR